jgi:hypothetical protein
MNEGKGAAVLAAAYAAAGEGELGQNSPIL